MGMLSLLCAKIRGGFESGRAPSNVVESGRVGRALSRVPVEAMRDETYIWSSSYIHGQSSPPNPCFPSPQVSLTRTRILSKHLLNFRHISLLYVQLDGKGCDLKSRSLETKS